MTQRTGVRGRAGAAIPRSGPEVVDNDRVPVTSALLRTAVTVTVITAAVAAAGCGAGHPPVLGDPVRSTPATQPTDAPGQLAGLAAAAQDHRFVVTYAFTSKDHATRTVLVSLALDGSWRVDVPGGALSGAGDVSMVGNSNGTFQCLLGGDGTTLRAAPPIVGPSGSPSPGASAPPAAAVYQAPACVKVAALGSAVPHRYDPVVEHFFTDWLGVLLDRDAPIEVFAASPLPHSTGSCFSVEPSSASLAPPIDAGVYCFTADGTMTAASTADGTLIINRGSAAAPPTIGLPGPVTAGPAAPVRIADA